MGMSLDDAATMAMGSPTIMPPTTTPKSVDDAAALALNQSASATVATVKNNVYNAAAQNPDEAAANQSLARQVGAPPESVAANPTPIKQQVAAQNVDVSNLMKTAPATTQFLTNPQNAAIAHDDIPNMAGIEQAITAPPTTILQKAGNYFNAVGNAIEQTSAQYVGTMAYPFLSPEHQQILEQKGIVSPAGGAPLPPDASMTTRIVHGLAGMFGADSPLGIAMSPLFLPVSAPLAPAFDAGMQKVQDFAKSKGLSDANASVIPDAVGIFMNLLGAKGIEHMSLRPSEAVNVPSPETNAVATAIAPHIENTMKAVNADIAANRMNQINAMAAESKVRARDPSAFQAFINDASQNAPIQDVYIDAKAFAQAAGTDLPRIQAAIPDIAEQLPQAMAAGQDLRIPVADFATHLAGTDMATALIPHLKTDPEGFSQAEAQDYMTKMGPQIEQDVATALKAKTEGAEHQAALQGVQDKIMGQLTESNRFTPDVNKPYAQMLSSFYDTMSKRTGIAPDKLLEQYPVKIRAESAGGGFDQSAEDEMARLHGLYPEAGEKVDGRTVREDIPNTSSIGASFNDYDTLPGVREVPLSAFENQTKPRDARTLDLADQIKESGELNPLIVAHDAEGPYILEGGHRFDALKALGAKSFPALVVRDFDGQEFDQAPEGFNRFVAIAKKAKNVDDFMNKARDIQVSADVSKWFGEKYDEATPKLAAQKFLDDVKNGDFKQDKLGAFDQAAPPDSPEFKKWFGDSKVVDAEGKPLTVYHGTTVDFEKFNTKPEPRGLSAPQTVLGSWFTDTPDRANPYADLADEGGNVRPAYLSLKNPYKLSREEEAQTNLKGVDGWRDLRARLEKEGYDGVQLSMRAAFADVKPQAYVAFHPEQIRSSITFNQDKLGAFNPKTLTISVMKGANLSTFLHESGHFFLHTLTDIASKDGAPEQIKADTQTLMDWFGVKDAAAWKDMSIDEQREAHEKFARSFEKYLLDGEAPSLELQPIFSRFRSWLLSVYKSASDFIAGHPEAGHMNDEVRGVFDRMLATNEQIGRAENARGMKPLFNTPEEAGMKPEEFTSYGEQAQQATSSATTELDARRLRDMQFASGARSEAIKALQREAASKRASIRDEVTKEVQAEPGYQAEQYIRKGVTFDGEKALGDVKLNKAALKEIGVSDENVAALGRAGYTSAEGLHPDALAELFHFGSGRELVDQLMHQEPMADKIKGLTDQRMLERHGDLTDPKSIAAAADRAIHNDVRTKVIATELSALNKQLGNKTLLTKAAKEFAEKIVAQLPANKINPNLYIAAAAKAGKLADAAFKSGDIKEAAEQKKNQLINQYAVKAAFEQKALVDKGLTFLKRFGNNAFREKVAGAYLEQIDGLLSKYDLRKTLTDTPTRAETNLTKWVESQREAGFEPYVPDFILSGKGMHYGDMSVEQFRGLVDTVRSMKFMADNLKEVTINGKKMAVEAAVNELLQPLIERGTKFTKEQLLNPPELHVDSFLSVALHKMASTLRLVDSDLKPQEFKRNEYDLHQLAGPFGRLLFEPMFERNYWKVAQLKEISTKFGEYGEKLGKDWQKSLYDLVPNKTLLDPDLSTETEPVALKMTRAKMLGIARHVGNESNFDKLTRGYNWKPADVWNFLHDNMTEKDWQATQAQWDVFEKYWPEIEGLSRRLGGVPPDKIPLRPFDTKFGQMKGGYSPIDYDPIRSKLSAKFGDIMAEPHEQIGSEPAYRATTTFNGSMQNRQAGYTDRVNLDYHGVESRLRDTIHDLAYREILIDTNKMITNPAFRSQFMGTFGREEYRGLQTWMRGIRDMNRDESQIKGFEKFLQYARTGVVMTGIAYRLSTVLKHGSSAALKSLGYLGDSAGAKYFAARAARMGTGNAQADIAGAIAKFPEIASRMNQMDRDYKVGTQSMYHAEDWRAKNDRFGHAMVAWSDMLTAVPTAWAAYDRATIEGIPESLGGTGKPMKEASAIAYANKVVREAHGTALEANRSLFLQARGIKGLFGTIYGFMNNTYGQLGDLMDKTVVGGSFQNKPALVARAMATVVAPAMMAAWVSGQFNDKDPWYKQAGKAILGEVAGTVPFVRDAYQMVERGDTSSAGETAPLRLVGDTVKVGLDAYKAVHGQKAKWIQDTANAMGELFHIGGLGQAGKSLQYLKDIHDGVQNPKSAKDFVTGVTIGPHPKQ